MEQFVGHKGGASVWTTAAARPRTSCRCVERPRSRNAPPKACRGAGPKTLPDLTETVGRAGL